ncbi:hypothetical protein NXS19_001771 [Fusarium pseudograminearum]|nr:hypothetical protein NXS19_001771 [Fusarium pseudograminearum]
MPSRGMCCLPNRMHYSRQRSGRIAFANAGVSIEYDCRHPTHYTTRKIWIRCEVDETAPDSPPPDDLCLFLARNAFKLIGNETELPSFGIDRKNTGKGFLDEWHAINAKDVEDVDVEDVDDEGDKDEERPEANWKDDEDSSKFFDLDDLDNRMSKIDLGDDARVKAIVASALKDGERDAMVLTDDHETLILGDLPDNQASVTMMMSDPEIYEAVLTFRARIQEVVDRLVVFALCLEYPNELPVFQVFAMFCMANADKNHRSRLVRLLTHASVIPIGLQYTLGLQKWTVDQFDVMTKLVANETKHFLTAYGGVAHCSNMVTFFYAGSASSTIYSNSLVGESRRMRDHHTMMQKGPENIRELRKRGDGQCLFVHEKMAESGDDWFFFPMFRYPLKHDDPTALHKSALALFAENCMMIFLSCNKKRYTTRKHGNQWFADVSHKILHTLRPKDFPVPPWDGANIALPMLQSPSCMWNLFNGRLKNVQLTPALQATLERHFQSDPRPWLSFDTSRLILKEHGYTAGPPSIRALADFYAGLLKKHGIEYENKHQRYLQRYSVLYVGIIKVVEDLGQVRRSVDGSYMFDADNVPWDKVAQVAQSLVSDDQRGNYSADACKLLYKSHKSAYFKQQVLNPSNWERLRLGVPEAFAHTRPRARFGKRMNDRIWVVCRHFLYNHLVTAQKIEETDDNSIRLRFIERARVEFLLEEVIEQLQKDVALDPEIRSAEGAWENESLKAKIMWDLYSGYHELETGVHRDIYGKWKTLEKLEPPSVIPFYFSIPVSTKQRKESEPDKQDPGTRAKLERLMASHVDPGLVAAQTAPRMSTGTPETSYQIGPGDVEPFTAFQLQDKGHGAPKVLFQGRSGQLASGSNSSTLPPRQSTTRKNRAPWVDDICPDCGEKVEAGNARAGHKRKCLGRCDRCTQEGLVCKLVKNGRGTCEECYNNSLECTRPYITTMGLFGAGICERCEEWKRDVKRHQKSCDGSIEPGDGFESRKKTCEDCGKSFTADTIKRHKQQSCHGRCTNCKNREPLGSCTRLTSSKESCKECKAAEQEETCDATWIKNKVLVPEREY